ncbi:MAG: insulinase family protein [Melioribacteraceae bacterium]|nr:insulinase family protein [Melioribacteraceae bacterium]
MKNKFLVIIALVFTASFYAQVDRSKMPEPEPAPEIQLSDPDSFTLDNGLKVFVVTNNKLPRISYSLVIDRDPILEGENAGYVSLTGQLLRTGTKTKTKAEIDEAVDFIGASLNASATGLFASSLKKHNEELLDIMADVLLNAEFKQEELDKLKKRTISGIKAQKDDPNAIAGNVRNALVYGLDHPYGEQVTEETVESVTLDICKDYYETYFSPSAAYFAIVGDIGIDEARELIENYFRDWQAKEIPTDEYKKPNRPLVNKVALVDRPQSVQSVIYLSYPIDLEVGDEDVIKLSVANTILGGYFSSKLNMNLREDKAYTYGARSRYDTDELVGRFDATTQVRNEVTDSTITEIIAEMKNMTKGEITDEELETAKNYLIGSFSMSLESPATIARFALNIERYDLDKNYYRNYLKNLNAVTREEVIAVSKKYFKPDETYILAVGKAEEIADDLKKFSLSGKINYYDIYGKEYDPDAKKVPDGVTVETIIDKYIEAQGGREKLESINDVQTVMKGNIQGTDITLTLSRKSPDLLHQVLDAVVFKQTTIFDGDSGAQVANNQKTMLEGERLEELKIQATMNLYFDYDKHGIDAVLKGIKEINGKDAYEIELTLPTGKKWYHYYDTETGFKIREVSTMDTPQGSFTQTVDMGDYKEIDGVFYPHKLTQQIGPQSIELEVTQIKVNQELSDSLFKIN